MPIFGRKHKTGEKKKKKKVNRFKYKTPQDVKMRYVMPILFILGIISLVAGIGIQTKINYDHNKLVMASSMEYGQNLPYFYDSKGQLKLGHTILSKDGKTLAAEIKYTSDAHNELSSFGNRYLLRLEKVKGDPLDVSMEYGIFSTDGSGVLTVHSPKGFTNQAFIVLLVDNGHLVSSDDLQSQSQMSDSDVNKSITAKLSDSNTDDSSETNNVDDQNKLKLPPIYVVRLNAKNAKRADTNWENDRELTYDLFVKKNLKKIENDQDKLKKKLKIGKTTLKEMNKRLKENPDDKVSSDNRDSLETQVNNLQNQLAKSEQNYALLRNSSISKNILDPKQRKHTTYEVNSLDQVMSRAKGSN